MVGLAFCVSASIKRSQRVARAMATLTDEEWARIEQAYRHGTATVAAIAAEFKTTRETIQKRRKLMGWPARSEIRRPKAGSCETGSPAQADKWQRQPAPAIRMPLAALGPVDKKELLLRFYRLLALKMAHMEADMARPDDRTPAENERETRALGALIRNFDKAFGLEQEQRANDDRESAGEIDGRTEAEAIRRELAERLVRLRKQDSTANHGS